MRKVILKGKSNSRLLRHRRMFSSEMNCSRSFRHPVPFLHCCLQYAAMCRSRKQIHEDAKVHKYLSHLCSFTGDCARRVLRRMPCVERRFSFSRRSWWFFLDCLRHLDAALQTRPGQQHVITLEQGQENTFIASNLWYETFIPEPSVYGAPWFIVGRSYCAADRRSSSTTSWIFTNEGTEEEMSSLELDDTFLLLSSELKWA